MSDHEFRIERFAGLDRESAYDGERRFARRRARRQLLGLVFALTVKAALSYLVYHFAGWWGVAAVATSILIVLFIRGSNVYPRLEH